MVLFSYELKSIVMYKVRCHGKVQEMEVKIPVFVKYGIVAQRYKQMFATSGVQRNRNFRILAHAWIMCSIYCITNEK